MRHQQVYERLVKYQEKPLWEPIQCSKSTCHEKLYPYHRARTNELGMACPQCGTDYDINSIPSIFFDEKFNEKYAFLLGMVIYQQWQYGKSSNERDMAQFWKAYMQFSSVRTTIPAPFSNE
jgi:hypothetical protein